MMREKRKNSKTKVKLRFMTVFLLILLTTPLLIMVPSAPVNTMFSAVGTLSEQREEINWSFWDTNHTLTENYEIPEGHGLIIEEGITICMDEDVSIIVNGILKANGTEEHPITFTHNNIDEYWGTIKFTNSCIDAECVVKHCNIWYGGFSYSDYGGIYCSHSSPTITENNFSHNHYSGIWSTGSPTITNNTFFNNARGVYAGGSPLISYNAIFENTQGIDISYSSGKITNNSISNNTYGLYCWGEYNPFICSATITNNTIVGNTYGIWLAHSWGGINIQNNTLRNNDHGIYSKADTQNVYITNTIIESSTGHGIYLYGASNNNIVDCYIRNNTYGILFAPLADNNNIQGCIISNNTHGIYIDTEEAAEPKIWDNTIVGNSILHSDEYGIYLPPGDGYSVGYFSVYHNNFVNNTINAEDNSAATSWSSNGEGNYWGDYNGTDNDTDGIGDAPYIIDTNTQDDFPLMSPHGLPEIKIESEKYGSINETLIFTAATHDPKNLLTQYTWDFDDSDGITVDAEGATVSNEYTKPESYTITLSTTDIFNHTTHTTTEITVGVRNIEISKSAVIESAPEGIKIHTQINNTGTIPVDNLQICFYNDSMIIDTQTISLPATSSINIFTTWKNASIGYHVLKIQVDPYNTMFENIETDNNITSSLNVCDIILRSENITATDTAAGTQITTYVENIGWTEQQTEIYFYADSEQISRVNITIPANSSQEVNILWNAPSGTHNISINIDPANKILETNKNNNIATATIVITGLPDLCILTEDITFLPYPPVENQTASVNITVRNLGYAYSSLAQLRVYDKTMLIDNFSILSLPPNGQALFSVNFTVCRDTEIRVEIESYGNEYNPANNQCTKTTNITLISDLTITSDDITFYPEILNEGQTALVYARIQNIGSLPSDESMVVFYDNEMIINEIPVTALQGYGSIVAWTEFTARKGHTITVKILSDTDGNPGNNNASKTITMTLAADLSITPEDIMFEAVPQPIENRSTIITATIKNLGDGVSETATVSFYIGSTLIDTVEVAPIAANSSRKAWIIWNNAKEGAVITVSVNTTLFDINITNNEALMVLEKTLKPDLIVSDINFEPSFPSAGQKTIIYAEIKNVGDGESDAAVITFYDNEEIINITRIGSILPNQTLIVWTEWNAKAGHTLSVTIQSENYESDITNNQYSVGCEVYVEQPPPFVAVIVIASIIAAIISFLLTERGKWKFLLLIAPLYTKIKKQELFAHEVRDTIYSYVKEHPGDHLSKISKENNLKMGTVVHHLSMLEKHEKIKSRNHRTYKYFWTTEDYTTSAWKTPIIQYELTKQEAAIYQIIKNHPGITQKDIVAQTKMAKSTISYYVDKMKKIKVIGSRRVGKEKRYFIAAKKAG